VFFRAEVDEAVGGFVPGIPKPMSEEALLVDELRQREKEYKEKMFNFKIQLATGQLANSADVKQVRRDIARIKTVIRQKELTGQGLL
jgi:large subunit ribosomal protein L29